MKNSSQIELIVQSIHIFKESVNRLSNERSVMNVELCSMKGRNAIAILLLNWLKLRDQQRSVLELFHDLLFEAVRLMEDVSADDDYESFEAIHHCACSTQIRGEIVSIMINEDNFDGAWELIRSRACLLSVV